jgi:poly(A) polymerase
MDHSLPIAARITDADWIRSPATQQVFALLNQQGFVGRAVGGCVRNSLLAQLHSRGADSIAAITDIDFATTATPTETIDLAAAAGLRTVPTGLQHGTVTVIAAGEAFEVTTLRRDVATDGRHADVAFTDDWALDAARRDLTINALYADADGTIFDPLGGLDDLHHKRIRFVGDARTRIQEDYLRILRFFRFFAQYGDGQPDAAGIHACITERSGLTRLSSERVHQELMKLLISPGAVQTLQIMTDHGLLTEILPAVPQLPRLARLIAQAPQSNQALRLAALSIVVDEDAVRIAKHLRLSRNETAVLHLAARVQETRNFETINSVSARQLLYHHGTDNYLRALNFFRALKPNFLKEQEWQNFIQLPDHWQPPSFPLNGRDLIELGVTPGPILGNVMHTLQQHWLKSDFTLKRAALLTIARTLLSEQAKLE